MNGIGLRLVTTGDVAAVQALHGRSFAGLAGSTYSPQEIAAHLRLIEAPAYRTAILGNNLSLAVTPDGRIVGTAGWCPVPERSDTARIRKVFVHPDLTRQGLGSLLVRDAERRARAAGFSRFTVRANLNAVPLYERLGYRTTCPGRMDVGDGVPIPVMFMDKTPDDLV